MKKVEAIIRKSMFSKVKNALHDVGVNFFSHWDVTGVGNEKEGHVYIGVSYSTSNIQRRYLSIVVNDDFEDVPSKSDRGDDNYSVGNSSVGSNPETKVKRRVTKQTRKQEKEK